MNQLTMAMKQAGVALPPQNKRIWLWLKDHPSKTTKELSSALNMPLGIVSTLVSDMYKRGMVSVVRVPTTTRHGSVGRYSTIGREFELLPKVKVKAKPALAPVPVSQPVVEKQEPVKVIPKDEPAPTAAHILETMSVKQAYELYVSLHEMFGGTK